MANKMGKRESRTKTPTGNTRDNPGVGKRKKVKGSEQATPLVPEEPEPTNSNMLDGDEIQALAIRPEDLERLHLPRPPREEQKFPVTSRILVRKHREQEEGKKRRLLVARPAPRESVARDTAYSGNEVPLWETHGHIQPHSILGTLQDLKREATVRGNTQVAELIPDSSHPNILTGDFRKGGTQGPFQKKDSWVPPKQDSPLTNWQHHMGLRKRQLGMLSRRLGKPPEQLLMNLTEDFRRIQEEKHMIDISIPTVEQGKGYRVGSEFWNVSEYIGDELTGLTLTLSQTERGFKSPLTYIGKPHSIKKETGVTDQSPFYRSWNKSLYLQQRRHDLRAVMEELNFTKPDIDGLEVIGRGRPFTSVSAEQFPLNEEQEDQAPEDQETEKLDPLMDFPDVVPDVILGPSLIFCGQLAQWVENESHRDKTGICTRITFEALAGEKASSLLEVVNNGSAAVWYEWRRLPQAASLQGCHKEPRVQRFYFNTSSGVILPGETQHFVFHFKSPSAGIFGENWEFCTHPVLMAGALLQVSLWGIALYEDKTAPLREALQRELESREALTVAQQVLQELLDGVHSPDRPQSPVQCSADEELFHSLNPKLHYKHQTVQDLHQLWNFYITTPVPEEQKPVPNHVMWPLEPISSPEIIENTQRPPSEKEESSHGWTLSIKDLKQATDSIPEDAARELFLSHLNKDIIELSQPPQVAAVDLLHQTCLQLWREAMDELVERSLLLRSVLEMPDKDVSAEFVLEESAVDQKPIKGVKEEKKGGGPKEEKKALGGKDKEDKKGGKIGMKEVTCGSLRI
ncbi:MYCBP-associated protein [Rhinophrynus dorsalis]